MASSLAADAGEVLSNPKISATQGGFVAGALDEFGSCSARIDDLDGDGVPELAVGEPFADDGGPDRGAVWILFLDTDGSVKTQQKISSTSGGFGGQLDDGDEFGSAVAFLGDLNGDGIGDLAVGAPEDDDGGTAHGAVWILRLDVDGTVKGHQKISSAAGGLSVTTDVLDDFDRFGRSLAWMGDYSGLGAQPALAVGVPFDDDGASLEDRGAVWILRLDSFGMVTWKRKISSTSGGFTGALEDYDWLGSSVAYLGDHDGDGVGDLAVGALRDDDGGTNRGCVYILFLDTNGQVKSHQKISTVSGGFTGAILDFEEFGTSVAALSDLDGDGFGELAVGSPRHTDGGSNRGAVWLLFLDGAGQVQSHQKISDTQGGFDGLLQNFDVFGSSLGSLGDFDGDGRDDLVVGVPGDDDGGGNFGAVWLLFLDGVPSAAAQVYGCGLNPTGSLTLGTTLPTPGATVSLILDNPVGTQSVGAATFVMFALAPWPDFPCGLAVGGLGMFGPTQPGGLLIDPTSYVTTLVGPPWPGSNPGALVQVPIPAKDGLLGVHLYAQGLLVDPTSAVQIGLTEGVELRIGS